MNWDLIGHEWAVESLKKHIETGRLKQAYLFCGPQSVGKRTLALRFAQALNCLSPPASGSACGECRACRLTEKMQYPDLIVVEAEQWGGTLKIDQVRELQHNLSLAPYEAKYRVALLLRFQEANRNAMNALLKTLEEPHARVIILITAESPDELLPTIVSRCEILRLRPIPPNKISQALVERFGLPEKQAQLFASISGGRVGYAIQLQNNPELLAERSHFLKELWSLLHGSRMNRFAFAQRQSPKKDETHRCLQIWLSFFRDVMLRSSGEDLSISNLDFREEVETLAGYLDLVSVQNLVVSTEKAIELLEKYINPKLLLENLLLDFPYIVH